MEEKLYTVAEANALLPHLAPTLVELRDKFEAAARARVAIASAASSNGGSSKRDEWTRVIARVDELMDRLSEWQLQLRDISTGLVDFPGIVAGERAWLCWRLGEAEVSHWHPLDQGYGGRRKLDEPG